MINFIAYCDVLESQSPGHCLPYARKKDVLGGAGFMPYSDRIEQLADNQAL